MNMVISVSVSNSNLTCVCFSMVPRETGQYIIMRGFETVTRDATIAEIFENVS